MGTDLDTRTTNHGMTRTASNSSARTMTIIGFICAAVSLLFLPIVFGPAAIVLGILAKSKGDPLGQWAAVAGALCMVAGMALGAWVMTQNT